jgi:DNA-binding MarR family transcriptional regulator
MRNTVMKTREESSSGLIDENSPSWNLGGADYLPYKISLVAKLLDRRTTRMLAEEFGLSVAEWRVLAQLAMCECSSVRDLAEQAWVDRAEVSRATASLVRRGYVKRYENPDDRRGPLLSCTRSGQALFRKIRPKRAAFHRSLTSKLDRSQIADLEQALLVLAQVLAAEIRKEATTPPRPRLRAVKT